VLDCNLDAIHCAQDAASQLFKLAGKIFDLGCGFCKQFVETIAESGVPGFDVVSWYGFFVPAKTPTEIITKMNADTIAALADPSVHGRLAPLGYESRPDAPETVGAFLRAEVEIWSRVIKQAGIGPEK